MVGQPPKPALTFLALDIAIVGCGGSVQEREGSRVAMVLNSVRANFHRPHPKPTTKKGAVDAVRLFLIDAGVGP